MLNLLLGDKIVKKNKEDYSLGFSYYNGVKHCSRNYCAIYWINIILNLSINKNTINNAPAKNGP